MINIINYDVIDMTLTIRDYESYLKFLDHMKNDKVKYSKLKQNDNIIINRNPYIIKDINNDNVSLIIVDTKLLLKEHYLLGNKRYIKTKFYFDDDDTREKAIYLNSFTMKDKNYKNFNNNEIIVPIKDIKK